MQHGCACRLVVTTINSHELCNKNVMTVTWSECESHIDEFAVIFPCTGISLSIYLYPSYICYKSLPALILCVLCYALIQNDSYKTSWMHMWSPAVKINYYFHACDPKYSFKLDYVVKLWCTALKIYSSNILLPLRVHTMTSKGSFLINAHLVLS